MVAMIAIATSHYRYLPLSLPPIRLKKEVFAGKGAAGMG